MADPKENFPPDTSVEIQELLTSAGESLKEKRPDKALKALAKIDNIPSFFVGHLYTQGLLYAELGKSNEAIRVLEKAVEIRPAVADYHLVLGAQYLKSKNIPKAIEAFETATFLDPGKSKPFLSLALANYAAGKIPQGNAVFKTFLKRLFAGLLRAVAFLGHYLLGISLGVFKGVFLPRAPFLGAVILERAKVLVKWERRDKAINILQKGYDTSPAFAPLASLLANQLLYIDQPFKAKKVIEGALEHNPSDFLLLCLLIQVNHTLGRIKEAFENLEKFEEKQKTLPNYYKLMGLTFYKNNQAEKALSWFKKAEDSLQGKPDFHSNFARILGSLGRLEEAEAEYKKVIAIDSAFGHGFPGLAKMGKVLPGEETMERLLTILQNPYLPQKARCLLNFAAGFGFEKGKQYDVAFSFFQKGNRLRDVTFVKEDWVRKVEDRKKFFSKSQIKRISGFGSESKKPIFIIGMPRSGTTLTEQILAAHPKVFGGGERAITSVLIQDFQSQIDDTPPWPLSMEKVTGGQIKKMARQYLDDIERVAGNSERVTDKMPGNFWEAGLIATLFPKAKIVHCRRDPLDTCLSNYFQAYFTFHPYAFRLETLGFYYKLYLEIMAHWHKVLPGRILDFDYEKTIANPKEQTQKLLNFCDLEWHDDCLNFHKSKTTVQTASFAQVRKPIYKTSAKKWKLYEKHLEPLKQALK